MKLQSGSCTDRCSRAGWAARSASTCRRRAARRATSTAPTASTAGRTFRRAGSFRAPARRHRRGRRGAARGSRRRLDHRRRQRRADAASRLRADRRRPVPACATGARRSAKLTLLSNGSTLNRLDVVYSLPRFDKRCMKLDAGDATTFRLMNAPAIPLGRLIADLRSVGQLTLQSMFVRDDEGVVDNTTPRAVSAWLEAVDRVRPESVDLYSWRARRRATRCCACPQPCSTAIAGARHRARHPARASVRVSPARGNSRTAPRKFPATPPTKTRQFTALAGLCSPSSPREIAGHAACDWDCGRVAVERL